MSLKPIYVLTGEEPLLQKMFIEDLRQKIFPNGNGGLNDDQFDSKEKTWAEIFDLANTFPMFAKTRMITVRLSGEFKTDDEDLWTGYVSNPPEHTVLVIQTLKLDKRKKVTKLLEKSGFLHDLLPPKTNMMPGWVDKLATAKGLRVASKARMALVDAIGTNLTQLNLELDKLELYVYPEKEITDTAVSKLVLKSTGDTIFQFTDEIMEGKTRKAFEALRFLTDEGTPALVMLSMILRHIKILILTKEAMASGTPTQGLAAVLKVPPFLVSKYADQARKHTLANLKRFLSTLRDLDFDLKSTGLSDNILVERVLMHWFDQTIA